MSSIAGGYSGDARIILNKNQTNMGLACHVNKLLHSVATGEFIALAAGDDVSTAGQSEIRRAWGCISERQNSLFVFGAKLDHRTDSHVFTGYYF